MTALDVESLLEVLSKHSNLDRKTSIAVAFSGGVDTVVLMHLLHCANQRFGFSLRALHINHNIFSNSGNWMEFCADFCHSRNIPFHSHRLEQFTCSDRVPEHKARSARYSWLNSQIAQEEFLLTGHHRNDQAETLMLNLMRGAGARGLSAIQEATPFGKGTLVRPMLQFSKQQILDYAAEHELDYVHDPSNDDLRYDRNYLRHLVLPTMQEHWGAAIENISRSAENLSDSRVLLDELAEMDAASCRTTGSAYLSIGYQLKLTELRKLSRARQINLIRYWIRSQSIAEPGRQTLDNFLDTTIAGNAEYSEMDWNGFKLYLFRKVLYLTPNVTPKPRKDKLMWTLEEPLVLEHEGFRLIPTPAIGKGIDVNRLSLPVSVGFRKGGERFRMPGRSHFSKLKKLLQTHHIPPCERKLLPLIHDNEELVAVVPWQVSDSYAVKPGQNGIDIQIELTSQTDN
ncbi:MAG: tRNA lysidine(34) synthetase TilS [Acidiferrobacterales bacterium]|nr:tRNA lysidine(34) synthetase TilS [Acidiferrobacterales bacterium]